MRRSPLKRGQQRSFNSTLRTRSKRTENVYKQRRPLVARLLAERPLCERCGTSRSTDCHEPKTRARGGSILDESNIVCLCRRCHSWIHDHPRQATEEGFLVSTYGDTDA